MNMEGGKDRICRVCGEEVENEGKFMMRVKGYEELSREGEMQLRKIVDWEEGMDRKGKWKTMFRGGSKDRMVTKVVILYIKKAVANVDSILGTNVDKAIRKTDVSKRQLFENTSF